MKNVISWNNVIKTLSFAFVLSLFTTVPAHAGDKPKENSVEIKYVGNVNGNTVFQINFDNAEGEEANITLKDEYGNILFFDTTKEKKYSKRVQFEGVQLEDLKLALSVRSKKGTQSQSFRISKTTRTVEEVAIVNL